MGDDWEAAVATVEIGGQRMMSHVFPNKDAFEEFVSKLNSNSNPRVKARGPYKPSEDQLSRVE